MKVILRFHHPDGTSKDWIAEASATELRAQFGKTGKRMQMHVKPSAQCEGNSPLRELQKKMAEKLAKGYVDITPASPQPASAPEPDPPKPARPRKVSKDLVEAMKEFKSQGPTWF